MARILALYEKSDTKLIFLQVPRWPQLMPALTPPPGAPDVRNLLPPSKNVVVVPKEEFEDLEEPRYFYDVLHVNTIARHEFTARFAKIVRTELGDLPKSATPPNGE